MPAANSVGRTVLGVSSGCQAFSRCCLNAVSKAMMSANELSGATADDENSNRTCWLFALVFCHVGGCKILKDGRTPERNTAGYMSPAKRSVCNFEHCCMDNLQRFHIYLLQFTVPLSLVAYVLPNCYTMFRWHYEMSYICLTGRRSFWFLFRKLFLLLDWSLQCSWLSQYVVQRSVLPFVLCISVADQSMEIREGALQKLSRCSEKYP